MNETKHELLSLSNEASCRLAKRIDGLPTRSTSLALLVVSYGHPDPTHVSLARMRWKGIQTELADDIVVVTRQQAEFAVGGFGEAPAPPLGRGERQLHRPPHSLGPESTWRTAS